MKQCPRCKSQLMKTHSEKFVCRACGYMTQKLEVARQNQQFQQHYNYSKKISTNRATIQQPNQQNQKQFKNHYLVSFQNLLKDAAKNLCKINLQYKKIEYHVKIIWFAYLNLASQSNIDISGLFAKLKKNKTQNKRNRAVKAQQDQNDDQQKNQGQKQQNKVDQPNQQPQKQAKNSDNDEQILNNQSKTIKKKPKSSMFRKTKKKNNIYQGQSTHQQKKIPFKTQVVRKFHQINKNQDDLQVQQQAYQFLKFLYNSNPGNFQEQYDVKSINYAAMKYAGLLAQNLQNFNLNVGVSQAKGKPHKLGSKQLQMLISMRNHKFTERNQIFLVLLLQDLLKQWGKQLSLNQQNSLQNLLLLYSSSKNNLHKPLISDIITRLKNLIAQSQQQNPNIKYLKLAFPTLSINLVYSIIYLASLINGNTLSIDDIVLNCGKLYLTFKQKNVQIDEKITNVKIRKTTSLLMRFLNIKCSITNASLTKWVDKYMTICGLQSYSKQAKQLTQILFKSYNLSKKQKQQQEQEQDFVIQKRFQFIEQDIIAKAIIIILMKIQIGFQKIPYLAIFPSEIISKLQSMHNFEGKQKYMKILRKINNQRNNQLNISKILHKLQESRGIYSKRNRQLKLRYSIQNTSAYQFLPIKQLISAFSELSSTNFSFDVSLAESINRKQYPSPTILHKKTGQIEQFKFTKLFTDQLQLAIQQQQKNNFNFKQLDIPSINYQFFFRYTGNLKFAGRDLFVLFAQRLAFGECQMRDLYGWLQKMEKVLVDFEN